MVITREKIEQERKEQENKEQENKEQENKEDEKKEDEKDKKKKKKPRKKLTKRDFYMYEKEWWELCNLIQAVDPNEVIPTNVLYAILDRNMPICDPSTCMEWSPAKKKSWKEKISSTVNAYESFTKGIYGEQNYPKDGGKNHKIMCDRFKRLLKTEGSQPLTCGSGLVTLCSGENGSLDQVLTRNILRNDKNLVQCREGDIVLRSVDLREDGYGNPPQMDREYKGDLNLLKPVIREYRPNNIGNERRSGGTCGTTYWITPVQHEAADAESAPMPLAMPCLVPRNDGERSSEGQPTHTASGEDDTTGKDRLAKMPQARSLVGLHQGSIGRKGSPDGGRARGGQVAICPRIISSAKAILIANLSSCDSDVLSEDKANNESKIVNESLTAELERYKERVKILEQRFNVDLSSRKKFIDSHMDDMVRMKNTKFAAFEIEIDTLKQTLSKHVKEKESLLTTLNGLHDEITEVQTVFTQIEAVVEQCSVEIVNIVLNSSIIISDSEKKNKDSVDTCNKCLELEAKLLKAKDTVKGKLKETIHLLRENVNPAKVKQDIAEIETINIKLEHNVAKLLSENEKLHKEKEHLKNTYKELYDLIKPTRVHEKEQCASVRIMKKTRSPHVMSSIGSYDASKALVKALDGK
ncbi:hypothetical protein Tco_0563428 [Tanacetum coccineum]